MSEAAAVRGTVVMVSQSFFPIIGGAENQALELAAALVRNGTPVVVLTQSRPPSPSHESIKGVPIHRLWSPGRGMLSSLFFMVSVFVWLARHARGIGVVHVHLASSHAIAAGVFGRLFHKPVVVKLGGGAHVGEIMLSRNTLGGRLKLAFLPVLKLHLVVVGKEQRDPLAGRSLERLPWSHIPNGVNLDVFHPVGEGDKRRLRDELGWSGFVFLFVGRFSNDKLPLPVLGSLLTAWAGVCTAFPAARLHLAGEGPLESEFRRLISDRHLENSVKLVAARREPAPLYQAADAFVLPSLSEGLSNALLEAMACGLPAVASRVPGITDVVAENREAFLFDPIAPRDIEAAMRRALDEPDRWKSMARNAVAAAKGYSLDRTVQSYTDLYAGLQAV